MTPYIVFIASSDAKTFRGKSTTKEWEPLKLTKYIESGLPIKSFSFLKKIYFYAWGNIPTQLQRCMKHFLLFLLRCDVPQQKSHFLVISNLLRKYRKCYIQLWNWVGIFSQHKNNKKFVDCDPQGYIVWKKQKLMEKFNAEIVYVSTYTYHIKRTS